MQTRRRLRLLEEPYRSRAVPPGSSGYWAWLFASREVREALLGMYALLAEWRALMDPQTEAPVAHIKLEWWRGEILRLTERSPAHPITRYIAALPGAAAVDLRFLEQTVLAAGAQVAGAPLERASELSAHAFSMFGIPLLLAGQLAGAADDATACITSLSVAEYLARSVADYRRDARAGRVPFAVDELLATGVEDADLAAEQPPPALGRYLATLLGQADEHLATATANFSALAHGARAQHRHLSVLASLAVKHGKERRHPSSADFRASDLYNAWTAARHATRRR